MSIGLHFLQSQDTWIYCGQIGSLNEKQTQSLTEARHIALDLLEKLDDMIQMQAAIVVEPEAEAEVEVQVKRLDRQPWPKSMAEQAQAVRTALAALDGPATAKQVAAVFKGARGARVTELLETLVSLGQAREVEGERFVAQ